MSVTDVEVQEAGPGSREERVVNDFAIQVATINGSGSQTANLVLLRAIFQMGVPVSGKNMFPSNIAGLPTWYTIRASADGFVGRKKEVDFLVAMNPETAREDVLTLAPGAAVVYDEPLKLDQLRSDLTFYPVPFDKLITPVTHDAKLRRLVRNMIYDGILSRLLSIDMGQMEKALRKQLGRKQKAIELNMAALKGGYDYAEANLQKRDPFVIEPMDKTAGKILIEGNAAAAIGCMMAGVTFVGWYPITPSSSLCESLIDYLKKYRRDPETGKATYAVIQAEDEMAALGMVIGAGWMGARAMTSTAGPGMSLMAEFTGLGYYAEVPAVIFDIQRVGPSTGLPTRTAQQDILSTAVLSHGDTKHPMLLPASAAECYTMAMDAFDLAERLQTPDLRDVGPRPRHEQLDGRALRVSDQAIRPWQTARRRDAQAPWPVRAVPGRRWGRDSVSNGARRWHAGVLHARLGAQRARPVQRKGRRLREQPGPARAQVRDRQDARSQARGRAGRRRRHRSHRLGHDALGDRRVARPAGEGGRARRPPISGCAPSRLRPKSGTSSIGANASMSSNRTATGRCWRC